MTHSVVKSPICKYSLATLSQPSGHFMLYLRTIMFSKLFLLVTSLKAFNVARGISVCGFWFFTTEETWYFSCCINGFDTTQNPPSNCCFLLVWKFSRTVTSSNMPVIKLMLKNWLLCFILFLKKRKYSLLVRYLFILGSQNIDFLGCLGKSNKSAQK